MAGATILRGFGPDFMQLERWGKKENVPLPLTTVEQLREVLAHKLPRKPPKETFGVDVSYDRDRDKISVNLDAATAEALLNLLYGEADGKDNPLFPCIHPLHAALEARKAYRSLDGEPGLEHDTKHS